MAFQAFKTFTLNGVAYKPGDVVPTDQIPARIRQALVEQRRLLVVDDVPASDIKPDRMAAARAAKAAKRHAVEV